MSERLCLLPHISNIFFLWQHLLSLLPLVSPHLSVLVIKCIHESARSVWAAYKAGRGRTRAERSLLPASQLLIGQMRWRLPHLACFPICISTAAIPRAVSRATAPVESRTIQTGLSGFSLSNVGEWQNLCLCLLAGNCRSRSHMRSSTVGEDEIPVCPELWITWRIIVILIKGLLWYLACSQGKQPEVWTRQSAGCRLHVLCVFPPTFQRHAVQVNWWF